ncbi:MAG TPA: hypothetical protein VK034_08390, partial [Enhygromyxa sp.]|nr:hypothetical protein [Enhygromyxa sp.]
VSIAPGSFFLGGMRLCLEQTETYRTQRDWLGVELRAELLPDIPLVPDLQTMPGQVRYDLVYLHAWQQPVSAVEDHELRERALGGPDSSTRIRRMRRVEIATNIGTDVPTDAFAALFANVEDAGLASYDHATAELISSARLTVSYTAESSTSACVPKEVGGYVGNDDQAIRVELRGPRLFCWGFCNAAPLYRVRVSKNDPTRVRFINQPRDGERAPKVGQIVELLPWSARLPNDEKVAELQGVLARVTSGYEADSREIVLDVEAPAEWLDWLESHDQHLSDRDGENHRYLYLRVWDRGSDTESPALIDHKPGKPVPLAGTGLHVTFSSGGLSGDHWIIAARKATPSTPTPWELLTGAAPHGTRHFYAPLAVIRWTVNVVPNSTHSLPEIIDARRPIRRMGDRGCCTITVGDGTNSHGLVDSIGEALAELPPQGGRICLLPGEHDVDDNGHISDRRNIEIVGCGPKSILTAEAVPADPDIDTKGQPIITLSACSEVRLRNFAVVAHARVGVKLEDQCERVWLEDIEFTQNGSYNPNAEGPEDDTFALSQPAILALDASELWIERCKVEFQDQISYAPAVVLGGRNIHLLDSRIQAGPLEPETPETMGKPFGGVHVLSQSVDVEIAANIICGGWGYGIAIGHLVELDTEDLPSGELPAAMLWSAGERLLGQVLTAQLGGTPHSGLPAGSLGDFGILQPCGPVVALRIHRNEIFNMGMSGVASAAFALQDDSEASIFLVTVELDLARNIIRDNARLKLSPVPLAEDGDGLYQFCFGGVCLSAAISPQIRENQILRNHVRDNGFSHDVPNVGIGIIAGQNVIIEDNRIIDNGAHWTTGTHPGLRGGIAVEEVLPVVGYTFLDSYNFDFYIPHPGVDYSSRESALTVRKNEVSQPSGKALWVRRAFGPVNVTENVLQSHGDSASDVEIDDAEFCISDHNEQSLERPAQGACVEIVNLGRSREFEFGETVPGSKLVSPAAMIEGGMVLFFGNKTSLDWTIEGGHGASVVISSLDAAVVNNNVMVATMHSSVSDGTMHEFIASIAGPDPTPSISFLLYHCYVGAAGTVQVLSNRFEEGPYDVAYSLVTAGALSQAEMADDLRLRYANLLATNIATHCIVGFTPELGQLEAGGNLVIFPNEIVDPEEEDPDLEDLCGAGPKTFDPSEGTVHVCVGVVVVPPM